MTTSRSADHFVDLLLPSSRPGTVASGAFCEPGNFPGIPPSALGSPVHGWGLPALAGLDGEGRLPDIPAGGAATMRGGGDLGDYLAFEWPAGRRRAVCPSTRRPWPSAAHGLALPIRDSRYPSGALLQVPQPPGAADAIFCRRAPATT